MTTRFPTAKEYVNLVGALCATGTAIYAMAHPDLDNSFAQALPVGVGSLAFMALGVGKGGQIVRRLAEQYSSKGAQVWEGVEARLGSKAPTLGGSTIFLTLTVGSLASVGIGNLMDSGVPLEAGMAASLAAGTLVTALQGIKEGIWGRMNSRAFGADDDVSDSPTPAAPTPRPPRR